MRPGRIGSVGRVGLTSGQLRWTPARLFAAGEMGAWYDPSDLSTLFQDSAGTMPVTAAGQPVGRMLDKSRGLMPGPQLVANGTSPVNSNGWTPLNGAVIDVVDRKLRMLNSTTANGSISQVITTVVGRTYRLSATISSVTGGISPRVSAGTANMSGDLIQIQFSGVGTFYASGFFVATTTTTWLNIAMNTNITGVYASFDDISVVESPGNHVVQANPSSRPLYRIDGTGRPYLQFDGIDDDLTAPVLNLVGAPSVAAVVGQRKERDAIGTLISHGGSSSIAGFWQIFAPRQDINYGWRGFSAANAALDANGGVFPQPDLAVVTGLFARTAASGVQITGRRNGAVIVQGGTDLAPFTSTSFTIGRRGPAGDLPYLGRVYGVIVLGATDREATIANMESWMNSKTGAYA